MTKNRFKTAMKFLRYSMYVGTILFCLLLTKGIAYAQDPSQYGTPFTGVPDIRDVNMYEVNTRAFSATGNFAGVKNWG